jgi:hypothetical protein
MFFIPFFILAKGNLKGTAFYLVMIWSLLGLIAMYIFEVMSMCVDGLKNYFSDGWNFMDQLIVPLYIAFCAIKVKILNYENEKTLSTDKENDLADL